MRAIVVEGLERAFDEVRAVCWVDLAVELTGFTSGSYPSFVVAVSVLQGAGFTGAATGVNLARDIEQGWFDRLLASPAPRWVLLTGLVLSASIRAFIPATTVLVVAFAIGAHWPGVGGLLITYAMVAATAAIAARYASTLALHYKTQSAAPLMQAGMLALIFLTTAYAPLELLQGWLRAVAEINPMTEVVDAVRQGFLGSITWSETWPGFVAVAGMLAVVAALSLRGMRRTAV